MTDFNKTKKELILELQKLQQQHYLLESSFNKGVVQQKRTDEALQASKDYLNKIINSVGAPIYVKDDTQRFCLVNDALCKFLNLNREDLIGKKGYELFPEAQFEVFIAKVKEASTNGKENFIEELIKDGHGKIRTVITPKTLYIDKEGNKFLIGVLNDVSERKQAEILLKDEKELLRTILESVKNPIFLKDNEHRIIFANRALLELLGLDESSVIGKTLAENIPKNEMEHFLKIDRDVLDTGIPSNIEEHLTVDGKSRSFITSKVRYRDKTGNNFLVGSVSDITERIEAEILLKDEKELLITILELVENPIFLKDNEHRITFANRAFYDLFGLDESSVIGKTLAEHVPKNEMKHFLKIDRDVLDTGIPSNIEEELTVGGKLHTIITIKTRFINKLGEKCIAGSIYDITERKQAEEALRKSEQKLVSFFEDDISAAFLSTPEGKISYCNKTFVELFGFASKEEAMEYPVQKLYRHASVREDYLALLKKNKKVENFGCDYLAKDGRIINGLINSVGEFNQAGELIQLKGYIIDVTDIIIAEESLRKLSQAVEQSPVSIIITDTNGTMEYANAITLNSSGYQLEELIGKNPRIFSSGEKSKSDYKKLWETIKDGHVWHGEFHNKKKNGELYWERASISPILNEKGEITHFLGVKEDITEQKLMLNDLIEAKIHAEESDRLKSAFLANMSHEIRTPMNGILGFTDLLKDPGLSGEKQQKYIKIIQKSGDRMLNIINDIVDISKIESGLMKVYIKETNINEILENNYNFFKPETDAKGIKLLVKKSLSEKEAIIKSDTEKINAILCNLVKNAIKFTNQGTIEFGVGYASSTSGQKELKFFVKDTGIGIAKDRQKAIFERFVQADVYDKMAFQGAGLGLSISKAYAEMLGGTIWLESEESIGTTFYFTIPCNREMDEKKAIQKDAAFDDTNNTHKNLKILIVEDDESSEMFLSLVVEELSSEIISAKTGLEAVEICRNRSDLDLILMDIKMPDLNGIEATKQIRDFNKKVIIIAQTAYGFLADRIEAIHAGCNDYIAKPIKATELLSLIQKNLNK